MSNPSRHLSPLAMRGLTKLGDVYCPGDDQLPAFSQLGCAEHVDGILEYMPDGDRDSLKVLLAGLGLLPRWVIALKASALESIARWPGPQGGPLRFLQMGMKGLVMTLYYSGNRGQHYAGPTPLEVLDYHVGVYTGDLINSRAETSRVAQQ